MGNNGLKSLLLKTRIYFKPLLNKSISNAYSLLIIMIPIIIVIKILQELNFIHYLTYPFAPIMAFLGIPEVYSLAWVGTILNNNYTAFSIIIMLFQDTPITYAQLTILAMVCLLCHSMITETIIASKLGLRASWSIFIRFASALFIGSFLNIIFSTFNILQNEVNNAIIKTNMPASNTLIDNSFNFLDKPWLLSQYAWMLEQIKTIILIFFIIFFIFLLVDILQRLKLLQKINNLFLPIFKILKITKPLSIVTLISSIIGLSYGYGVLKEAKENNPFFRKEQIFNVLTFISLMHALIEDSLIFIILGASFWTLIIVRFIYVLIICYTMHKYVLPKLSTNFKYKYLYKK